MRIAIFSLAPLYEKSIMGGSQKILHELSASLGGYGHKVKVWCSAIEHNQKKFSIGSSEIYPNLLFRGKFPSPYQISPINLIKTFKVIREASDWADKIYLHADGIYLRDSFSGKKIIRSFHDFIYDESIISALSLSAQSTIVPSDYLKHCIEATLVLSKKNIIEPIFTVPNGISFDEKPRYSVIKNNNLREVNLLFPHRPQIAKGVLEAIKISVKLQSKIGKNKVNLMMPYFSNSANNDDTSLSFEQIVNIAKNEKADNIIKLHQWVPYQNMNRFYSLANVTICPGNFVESFGLVPLESVANNTPAVCSLVGGFRNYTDIPAIKLFPFGDIDRAVDNILNCLEISSDDIIKSKDLISHMYSYKNMIYGYEKIITSNNVIQQKIIMKNKYNLRLAPWCYIDNDYIYNDYKSEKLFINNIGSVIGDDKTLDVRAKELDPDKIKKSKDLGYFIEDYKIEKI